MLHHILFPIFILPVFVYGQMEGMGIGLKAGVNFANVTDASSINSSSRSGFHVGAFLAPSSKSIIGSRTELIFSRQGYNYKSGTNTGNVNLDYIMLPQYMCINITKYFSIQLGGQMAYLLNAKADSSSNGGSGNPYAGIMNYYNKLDFGYGGGIEVHPVSGLLIGARVNISFGNLYSSDAYSSGTQPSFVPNVDVKNNLFQIFAGWQFGKHEKKEKKPKKESNQSPD
jgi:hypothetical protein